MKISTFDGSEDAYWWIICSEKSFNNRDRRLSDAEKVIESILAMRGSALTWWFSWSPTHRRPSWDAFTCALLRQFKPEWIPILPGEEEDEEEKKQTEEEPVTAIILPETQSMNELPENTEFIASVKEEKPTVVEEPKMLVLGSEFFSMTESNHQIVEEEDKEDKKQEFKTHHDSLSISLCPKPPPTTQFPSTLPAPAPPLKPPDPPPKPPNLLMAHSAHSLPISPSEPPPLHPPSPKPPDILDATTTTTTTVLSPLLPFPPPKPPDKTLMPISTPKQYSPPPQVSVVVSPESLQPPPKPPDVKLSRPPPKPIYRSSPIKLFSISDYVPFYKHHSQSTQFQLFGASTIESWTFNKNSICVQPQCPITGRHVSPYVHHKRPKETKPPTRLFSTMNMKIFPLPYENFLPSRDEVLLIFPISMRQLSIFMIPNPPSVLIHLQDATCYVWITTYFAIQFARTKSMCHIWINYPFK
jgi:hypothetical protein